MNTKARFLSKVRDFALNLTTFRLMILFNESLNIALEHVGTLLLPIIRFLWSASDLEVRAGLSLSKIILELFM